jgi:hypothetical protein
MTILGKGIVRYLACPIRRRTASLLAHLLDTRALPLANATTLTPNRPEDWQNSPIDALGHVWQDGPAMTESENRFSLTRAASITGGAAKNQILICKSEKAAGPGSFVLRRQSVGVQPLGCSGQRTC